jgi:hypothetical protein
VLRILRAFAWMRWRVLVNSIERTGARDTLERFSIAIEQIAPLIALLLFVPSALFAAGLGAATGYALADGNPRPLLLEITRFLLLAAVALSVAGPIVIPAAERTSAVRLLLLPISRPTLYVAQTVGALTDPWVLLAIPLVLLLPAGLAAGGAFAAAAVALLVAILLVATLVGLVSLATSLLHVVVRDRRRGELIALLFILALPMVGMLFAAGVNDGDARAARRRQAPPARVHAVQRALAYVPSERYVAAVRAGTAGDTRGAMRPIAALGIAAVVLHALALAIYGRLLDSPAASGGSRHPARRRWSLTLPGVSAGTSAVALAQLRLVARTPRGRSMVLSPLIVVVMFGAMMYRGSGDMQLGFIELESGVGLATFGAFAALLSILPAAMNQFAIDGGGLTLAFLSPLGDRELLAGKAIGNGLVLAGPALLCMAGAFAAFPGGSPWLWLSLPLAVAASYVLVTPAAAALSAIFPRAVDMNSIGRGSNAHGAAGLIGFLAFLAAGAPCGLLVLLATRVLRQPALAPLFLLVWLATSVAIAAALFLPVRKLFARRRENLGMIV